MTSPSHYISEVVYMLTILHKDFVISSLQSCCYISIQTRPIQLWKHTEWTCVSRVEKHGVSEACLRLGKGRSLKLQARKVDWSMGGILPCKATNLVTLSHNFTQNTDTVKWYLLTLSHSLSLCNSDASAYLWELCVTALIECFFIFMCVCSIVMCICVCSIARTSC